MKIKNKKCIIYFTLVCICLLTYWGTKSLVVTEYSIISDKIPENFTDFRITQITDLHNAEFGKDNIRLVNEIKKTNPNIIVLTGDIIDSRHTDVDVAVKFMEQAVRIAPTYYVMGNHEVRILNDYVEMEKSMIDLGVTVLRNKADYIEIDGQSIQIIGIDDTVDIFSSYYDPKNENTQVGEFLNNINDYNMYSILLSHRPELFDEYVKSNVDLVFAGHTHGGQIRLPFLGGIIAPDQGLFPKFDNGLFKENETNMIISRGVGNSIIPVRTFNRPEIVVVTISQN